VSLDDLSPIFLLLAVVLLFAGLVGAVQRRQLGLRLPSSPRGAFLERACKQFVVGTDGDLKVEFAFLAYLSTAIIITNPPPSHPRYSVQLLPAVLSFLLGFYFRQWLSKWRLRNIVSLQRLRSSRMLVGKPNAALAFALTNILVWYILYVSPLYALCALAGVFLHEVILETQKNTLVLRRRLHLFDLESFSLDKATARVILRIPRPLGLRGLHALIKKELEPRRRLALRAFRELVTNDQDEFYRLLETSSSSILPDADLCYYFGRALYTLGDIPRASTLLAAGCEHSNDARCAAYLALAYLGEGAHTSGVQRARQLLEPHVKRSDDSTGTMFAHAYYALASILQLDLDATFSAEPAQEALYHIHRAIRINEGRLAAEGLGKLSYAYYRGNELIFMDICGYIVFRLGEPRLAYRILEGVIRADNTYPWPYYHIALIYKRTGKEYLARALFHRIAVNERTDSVIHRLALTQLEHR
jgi:tetratricopeptide (TPR) repeat protein